MEGKDRIFLTRSLKLLETWIPGATDIWMKRYEENGRLYDVSQSGPYVHCLQVIEEAGMRRIIQLVYEGGKVAADCAAWFLNKEELLNEENRRYLEEESDWEYWECEIAENEADLQKETGILIYTNAYTTRRWRRKGIFHRMIRKMEEFVSQLSDVTDLYSVISLDPDVACYGEDKLDEPYYYSMADEPVRLLNAEIIEKCGFTPLKLETDEPVEDGSILWFAVRHVTYINV